MKMCKQLYPHRPDEGLFGDCFRTCVGCLLDMRPQEVPHFYDGYHGHEDATEANKAIKYWLAQRGYFFCTFAYQDTTVDHILEIMGINNPNALYLITGRSPRGTNHCCIGLGGEIIWDPAPEAGDLVGPNSEGQVIIEVLMPISQNSGWSTSPPIERENELKIGGEIIPEQQPKKQLIT